LIVFHCEEISKANFSDKSEVMQTARLKVRRGEIVCALCSGTLAIHDCYPRHCLEDGGKRHDGWIAQGHCVTCNVYPALIPSFIKPRKHYKSDVIERVIESAEAGDNLESLSVCAADISTMRRWVRGFKERVERVVSCLISGVPTLRNAYIGSYDFHSMTLMQQLSRLLSGYPARQSGGVIANVNIILTTHNCGFL